MPASLLAVWVVAAARRLRRKRARRVCGARVRNFAWGRLRSGCQMVVDGGEGGGVLPAWCWFSGVSSVDWIAADSQRTKVLLEADLQGDRAEVVNASQPVVVDRCEWHWRARLWRQSRRLLGETRPFDSRLNGVVQGRSWWWCCAQRTRW